MPQFDRAKEVRKQLRDDETVSFEMPKEWAYGYKKLVDMTEISEAAFDAAWRAARAGYADDQTILIGLVRALRLTMFATELSERNGGRWLASSPERSYHLYAAMATAQSALPLARDEWPQLNGFARQALDRSQPLTVPEDLRPLLSRGHAWFAAPEPGEAGFSEVPFAGGAFYFDRAQAAFWAIGQVELDNWPGGHDDLPDFYRDEPIEPDAD